MKNKKVIILLIISIVLIGIFSIIISRNGIIVREKKIIKEMNESTQVTELNSQITNLNKEHENYLNYIQTCKTKIATALTNEGVATSDQITLEEMAANIPNILQARTSDATATADNISEGFTAYVNGELITGTGADNKASYEQGSSILPEKIKIKIAGTTTNPSIAATNITLTLQSNGTYKSTMTSLPYKDSGGAWSYPKTGAITGTLVYAVLDESIQINPIN